MNFNANAGVRNNPGPGPSRKVKRVADINALGSAPIPNNPYIPTNANLESIPTETNMATDITNTYSSVPGNSNFGYIQQPSLMEENMPRSGYGMYSPQDLNQQMPRNPQQQPDFSALSANISMLQQPVVQDMAMQYGQKLADQGKQLMENQFEKWIPVTRLKYYFAVDNKYVINKIKLLFFPFTHKDWSLKFDQENPVQPRYDVNAPDLYIPTMAYITYVVLAGLMLGMQNRFTPEQLGIQASSALAYSIFEMIIYTITLYVANIPTNLKTLDLVAFSGYKFVIMVACVSVSILFYRSGYYIALIYTSLSLGFFLLRTLRTKVLNDANAQTAPAGGLNYDPYGTPQSTNQFDYTLGRKRKLYFLFLVIGIQIFLTFWLSKHLILYGLTSNVQVSDKET
ncbi:protein YIF1B-B [Condylostylus longicornis]|uniref:protein YIF1B-B n=1 Tax=Condylostylus longicornis TaxID=2530218 RepID=UPI00244DAE05|nr:protein YIF1B-B [Condylostylus longicornis]